MYTDSYNYSIHKHYALYLLGCDYFSVIDGLRLHSRDLLENIINKKSITYMEADKLYTRFDTLNEGFHTYYVDYISVYGDEQFKEIYDQPHFRRSNFAQMMIPIAKFFSELKKMAEGKEELALGSDEVEYFGRSDNNLYKLHK